MSKLMDVFVGEMVVVTANILDSVETEEGLYQGPIRYTGHFVEDGGAFVLLDLDGDARAVQKSFIIAIEVLREEVAPVIGIAKPPKGDMN